MREAPSIARLSALYIQAYTEEQNYGNSAVFLSHFVDDRHILN